MGKASGVIGQARQVPSLAFGAFREWTADRCDGLAGSLAFCGALTLGPFLAALVWAAARLAGQAWTRAYLVPVLVASMGPDRVVGILAFLQQTEGLPAESVLGLGAVGVGGFLLGASGYFLMVQNSLETIWDVRREDPHFRVQLRKRLLGLAFTLASAGIVLTGLMLGGLLLWLLPPGRQAAGAAVWALQMIVTFLTFTAMNAFWFRFLLPVRLGAHQILPWAALIAALQLLGRTILTWRLATPDAGHVDVAGSIVLTLLWLYYGAMVFLYGAELMHLYLRRAGLALPTDVYGVRRR